MCDLISLGDFCGAYALILQSIFKMKPNMLFDLGFFHFNNIIKYLNKNDLSAIYKTDYLVRHRTNEPILDLYIVDLYKLNIKNLVLYLTMILI